ncbi:hypothetical protein Calkr_2163 [Caldicellulosiruptor acetigenus I77R1B]|uniref:Uncharacterized protein n=1 Tax=Caldicellulosiruptor acetigenus (strain ATCC 700853 / DSM 12137 / I77R1B) TaxID=632335 RepID=E4S5W6_CALA7|nr:hypothetical protein [Caldicellulosiruptor acetigenus]ADQ41626.1 hypothetical protein Calkr_2163 [Caldicellulosiruptor acetigenus I77R1B]
MLELSERDEAFFEMVVKFKMVSYEMAREVYRNKKAIYNRIGKMIDEGVLKKVGWNNITLTDSGAKLIEEVYGLKFEPLSNPTMPEMVGRWKNVVRVGFRKYIMPHFITCWELKSESRKQQGQQGKKEISDKNKVLGVAKGYAIFKVSQKASMKVLSEMIDDINELVEHDIHRFIILCEGEKLKDFLQVVLKYSTRLRVQALHTLPLSESGLQIMDVIIGIPEWKYRVATAVYGNTFPSRHKVFDFESGGKLIYIGIDGEMISKNTVENALKSSSYTRAEILCLKGQEWRFEGIPAGLKTITLQEFLNVVGYELTPGSQPGSQARVSEMQ